MSDDLTPKQDAFVKEYILNGGNGTQAAITAGYSPDTAQQMATENLTKPLIKAALGSHKEELKEEFTISIEKKKMWLEEIIGRCMQHEPVMDKDGPTGEYKFGANDAIKAINELNKMDGDHAAIKTDNKHKINPESSLSNLSSLALLALVEGRTGSGKLS